MGMPNPIAVVDYDGLFTAVNPAFTSLFGFMQEEAMGHRIADMLVPDLLRDLAHRAHERARNGETVSIETERRRKDGRLVKVRLSLTPTHIGDRPAVLSLYTDVTELREAQARFEQVIAASTAVIYATAIDGESYTPTFVSQGICRASPATTPTMRSTRRGGTSTCTPTDRDRVVGEMPRLLATGELVT